LLKIFDDPGCAAEAPESCRPLTVTSGESIEGVMLSENQSPSESHKRKSAEMGIFRAILCRLYINIKSKISYTFFTTRITIDEKNSDAALCRK
jgi:hypothetical protein